MIGDSIRGDALGSLDESQPCFVRRFLFSRILPPLPPPPARMISQSLGVEKQRENGTANKVRMRDSDPVSYNRSLQELSFPLAPPSQPA